MQLDQINNGTYLIPFINRFLMKGHKILLDKITLSETSLSYKV